MKFLTYFFILFSIFIFGSGYAQTGFIPLSVDYALFGGEEKDVFLEVYLAFQQSALKYVEKDSKFVGEYVAMAEVQQNDSIIVSDLFHKQNSIDSLGAVSSDRQFVNTFAFKINPGSYRLKVLVRDANSKNVGKYELDIHASGFSGDSLQVSQIQLCSKIQSSPKKETEFYKNTFIVIPNPGAIFSVDLPVLYYYAEVYNLSFDSNNPGTYLLTYYITDNQGNIVKNYPEKEVNKPGTSAVIVGGNNIITLAGNTYFFNLKITDQQTGAVCETKKRFSVVKGEEKGGGILASEQGLQGRSQGISQYSSFSESELDAEFRKAGYIATKEEKKIYKTLNTEGKRAFLVNFWNRRDIYPETPVNEYKMDYFERANYAQSNFGSMNRKGWNTERGRVLLVYGRPDEIERHQMDVDRKPYEIWQYHDIEGGVIFVFADLSGFGSYELIHSTYSKELYQPDWERLVYRTQQGFDYNDRR